MGIVLVTGASGFIGKELCNQLKAAGRQVVALSRKAPPEGVTWVRGSFDSFEDLRGLDSFAIEAVVHLAAVTGGCSEEDGLAVNVLGTRRMMRYLLDRGCRRFFLASSIAAVGCLTGDEPRFKPLHVPISAHHPCVGRDAYGLSKYLMELMLEQYARIAPDAEIHAMRFGAVVDEKTHEPPAVEGKTMPAWATVLLGRVALADVIGAVRYALDHAPRPGFFRYHLVAPDSASDQPMAQLLREYLGQNAGSLDLSYYEKPGNEHAPFYSLEQSRGINGYPPRVPMRPAAFKAWKASQ